MLKKKYVDIEEKEREICALLLLYIYAPPVRYINVCLLAFSVRIVCRYNRAKSIDSGETSYIPPSRIMLSFKD